jgi:hypothetical protein
MRPAINVTSSQTLNAAMCGFAELRGQRALSAAAAASVSVQRSSTTRFESCLRLFTGLSVEIHPVPVDLIDSTRRPLRPRFE